LAFKGMLRCVMLLTTLNFCQFEHIAHSCKAFWSSLENEWAAYASPFYTRTVEDHLRPVRKNVLV
jgi:hypothetical protein